MWPVTRLWPKASVGTHLDTDTARPEHGAARQSWPWTMGDKFNITFITPHTWCMVLLTWPALFSSRNLCILRSGIGRDGDDLILFQLPDSIQSFVGHISYFKEWYMRLLYYDARSYGSQVELETNLHEVWSFTITERAPTHYRAFSQLKAPASYCTKWASVSRHFSPEAQVGISVIVILQTSRRFVSSSTTRTPTISRSAAASIEEWVRDGKQEWE